MLDLYEKELEEHGAVPIYDSEGNIIDYYYPNGPELLDDNEESIGNDS